MASSSATLIINSVALSSPTRKLNADTKPVCHRTKFITKLPVLSRFSSNGDARSAGDAHSRMRSLESLFRYDKAIPEERIEKPVGVSLAEKLIGDNPRCDVCHAKGAILCTTCSGSGLYIDSIMESQGILVKVRCLGCGGSGNVMCCDCGGRGHL